MWNENKMRKEKKKDKLALQRERVGGAGSAPSSWHLKHFHMFIIIIWEETHSEAHTLPANQNIPAGAHKGCVWARVPIMSVDGRSMSMRPCLSACLGGRCVCLCVHACRLARGVCFVWDARSNGLTFDKRAMSWCVCVWVSETNCCCCLITACKQQQLN